MNNGPISRKNALIDILLKGLELTSNLNEETVEFLSKIFFNNRYFQKRIEKEFVWQQLLKDDKENQIPLSLSARDLVKINALVDYLGREVQEQQPSTGSQLDDYYVKKTIKKAPLIALYPIVGPSLLKYVRDLCPPNSEKLNPMNSWLQALQNLYHTAHEETDLFHGLFLSNHNFAKHAYELAKNTTLEFSTAVLTVCAECRFCSLTMDFSELEFFFEELENFYKRMQNKRCHDRAFGSDFDETTVQEQIITPEEIIAFIKEEKHYPKTLLWRHKQEETSTNALLISTNSLNLSSFGEEASSQDKISPAI